MTMGGKKNVTTPHIYKKNYLLKLISLFNTNKLNGFL